MALMGQASSYAAAGDPSNAVSVGEAVTKKLVDSCLKSDREDDDETAITLGELEETWGQIVEVSGFGVLLPWSAEETYCRCCQHLHNIYLTFIGFCMISF